MSPEALSESSNPNGERGRLKIGRASDIWSLGCILYEMTYGRPPFAHFSTLIQRLKHIMDPQYQIEYPDCPNLYLLDALRRMLNRSAKDRITLPQLLTHPFLRHPPHSVLVTREQIGGLLERFAMTHPDMAVDVDRVAERIFRQWLG